MKERYRSIEMAVLAGNISAAVQFHVQGQYFGATEKELHFERQDATYNVKFSYVGGDNFTAEIAIDYGWQEEYLEDGGSLEQGVKYVIDSTGIVRSGYLDKSLIDGSESFFTADPDEIKHFSSRFPSSVFAPPPITMEELTLLNRIAMDPLGAEELYSGLSMPATWPCE